MTRWRRIRLSLLVGSAAPVAIMLLAAASAPSGPSGFAYKLGTAVTFPGYVAVKYWGSGSVPAEVGCALLIVSNFVIYTIAAWLFFGWPWRRIRERKRGDDRQNAPARTCADSEKRLRAGIPVAIAAVFAGVVVGVPVILLKSGAAQSSPSINVIVRLIELPGSMLLSVMPISAADLSQLLAIEAALNAAVYFLVAWSVLARVSPRVRRHDPAP
jgi:hypothetical protein